jgi:hypothetical protein
MSEEEKKHHAQKTTRAPLSWEAHEYVHTEKTADWYWAFGILTIACVVGAIVYGNVLFAILIFIIAAVLALFAGRHPDMTTFSVTQRGVRIGHIFHPYTSLESFAIEEYAHQPNHIPKLLLRPLHHFSPLIVIPIEGVDPDDIHDFLIQFLPEDTHLEPLSHRIMEWLGF